MNMQLAESRSWQIPFGKYSGKNLNSIYDVAYLKWFIGKLNNDTHIKYIAERIVYLLNKKHNWEW